MTAAASANQTGRIQVCTGRIIVSPLRSLDEATLGRFRTQLFVALGQLAPLSALTYGSAALASDLSGIVRRGHCNEVVVTRFFSDRIERARTFVQHLLPRPVGVLPYTALDEQYTLESGEVVSAGGDTGERNKGARQNAREPGQ